jgi:PKD repeat protein/subtilisin-like proprotein convertase family protein
MIRIITALLILLFSATGSSAQSDWTPVSPDYFPTNASGQIHGLSRVSQVKFHPSNASKMYAVSARGGLFITTNAGTSWTLAPGCDFMPTMRLASVCVDFTNDQVLYLGTGDINYYYPGSGVYKSTDGGTTFSPTTLTGKLVVEILMDPTNHNTLIAATNAGIYKSTNAGSTWTLKTSGSLACRDMVFKARTNTKTLFASTYSELYRSTDMGETWTQLTSGIYIPSGATTGGGCRVAVTQADSNIVYFAMIAKNGTIFKSTDGGNNFSNVKDNTSPNLTAYDNTPTSTGQGDYNCMFNVDPQNANILYFGAHNFWKSTDGGANWLQLTNWWAVLHTDMHWVQVNPYDNTQIWTANDGGVWKSTNGGSGWTPISDGIYGYEIYHGVCSPTRRDMFSIGTQDNGELYHSNNTWYCNRGGDWGTKCAFDYRSNSSMIYYFDRDKRRLVTGGESTYGLPIATLQDIAFYRNYPNLAFAGNGDVYRTTNLQAGTPSWTQISSFNKTIKALHVNLADSNRVYVITSDANIYVCNNALSASPVFTNYVLPNSTNSSASITSIKSSPDVLYAVLNTRVYRSADNGATWTNVSYNLPSINWVEIIPDEYFSDNELVFVAGNASVYYKKAGQVSWTLYSNALPTRTNINDFSIYDDGTNQSALRVSEYGRGMWEVPMGDLRNVLAAFSADPTTPCPGGSVQFNDLSTGNVISWNWSFPGGIPSSSSSQNPQVVYNSPGIYDVTLTVTGNSNTSSITKTAYINTNGNGISYEEGFEDALFPPSGWTLIDDGNDLNVWERNSSAGGFGLSSSSMYFNNFSINVSGKKDEMQTRLDVAGLTSAQLTFDVAYQPYNTTNYSDSLQVLVSTNCGASFTSVYLKGGGTLATVAGTTTSAFVPASSQWRTETISLNGYLSSGSLLVSFKNLGHYGNNLYIDNVAVNGTIAAVAGPDRSICYGVGQTIGAAGVSGFTYSWSPATGLSSSTVANPTATPNTNTTYILTTTKNGSTLSATDTVVVTVDLVPISTAITNTTCYGGSDGAIDLTFTSGIPAYSYVWSDGPVSQDRNNLTAGTYYVTITDGAGCSRVYGYTVTQPLTSPSGYTSTTQATCGSNNGSATLTASGGTGPYTYLWSNGGTTSTINNVYAGTYTVTITDSRGCTGTVNAVVTSKPLPIITSFNATPSSVCPGGSITLAVNTIWGTVTNVFSSGTLNLPIPDNNPAGVSNTIPVSSDIVMDNASRLMVTLVFGTGSTSPNREHTRAGDLKVTLNSPGGNTVVFDRPGVPVWSLGNDADLNGQYGFTTTATELLPQSSSAPYIISGNVANWNYKPTDSSNPDAAHAWSGLTFPLAVNGNWMITVSDNAAGEVGDLVSWSLTFVTPYSHSITGPGTMGTVNCLNSNCSNANVTVNNVPAGLNSYQVVTTSPDGCSVTSNTSVSASCDVFVNVKMFIEGYYLGGGKMMSVANPALHPTLCDTIRVELHSANAPYDVLYFAVDTLDINGNSHVRIPDVPLNNSYYIVVKHRNSLETWSNSPVVFNASTISYDFAVAALQAYGNNVATLSDGNYALWSGDIDQDGDIDTDDFHAIENNAQLFITGYSLHDITGNGIVESADFSLVENNLGRISLRP